MYNTLFVMAAGLIDSPYIGRASADDLLPKMLDVVYFSAGFIAVIALIIAGFLYVTSTGDPAKAKIAKNAILYSVIGLITVLLAFTITTFIRGQVG